MSRAKRLYIITGKGGVGKTTIALALVKRLTSIGVKAKYLNFTTSSLERPASDIQEIQLAKKMNLPHTALVLLDTATEYVGKKMKSQTVAKWVVRSPFFKALLSMIPGFNYLIYLGKTLENLKNDEDLVYVLDSPSSGHALTMLEATQNFADIFQSGILFEDTQKMIQFLNAEKFAQINIVSLPTLMAVNEACELETELRNISPIEAKIFCNNSFKELQGVDAIDLPSFLEAKLSTEREIASRMDDKISAWIKHSLNNNEEAIVEDLLPLMDNLL